LEPVDVCVGWSIDNEDAANISQTGELTINEGGVHGEVITVRADVENGRRILTHEVELYVPNGAAIAGTWTEVNRLDCPGQELGPADPGPIGEIVFFQSGDFWVTWTPFELYVDYVGTYVYDNDTGALTMTSTGGNYVPADFDLEGTAQRIEGEVDQVILTDMWLGSPIDNPLTPQCGHVLE